MFFNPLEIWICPCSLGWPGGTAAAVAAAAFAAPPPSHEGNVIFKSSSLEFLGPPLAQAVSVQTVSSFSPAILSRPLAE